MKTPYAHLPILRSGRTIPGLFAFCLLLGEGAAQNTTSDLLPPAAANDVLQLDAMAVTGTTLRSQEEIENRRESLQIADSLTMDELGHLGDENLADALVRLPGVSTMQTLYGEQEASYVSIRGISPDLNFVSFDGITMFSTANDGDGLRRVDLNLIPTQISRTTRVFKSFTADLDAGAIGGVTNIEPYSGLMDRKTANLSFQLRQETGEAKYVPADNSLGDFKDRPLGGAAKGLYVNRFGRDGRFGVVVSGVYRDRNYTYTKTNPNGRVFYTATGATASSDLSNWDGLHPFPTLYRPMDYTKHSESYGGSAQFEYKLSDAWHVSLLGFGYRQNEDQNLNQFFIEQFSGLERLSPEIGRFKIGRNRSSFSYDRFEQETRGIILKAIGRFADDSSLEIRAGRYLNEFYDQDLTATYAFNPSASYATFDMSNQKDQVTVENYEPMVNPANFRLNAAADNLVDSEVDSKEARIDYKKNYTARSVGWGFAAGLDYRQTKAERDGTTVTYTNNSSPMGDVGFVPDFISRDYAYPVLWVDYATFAQNVKPNLAINKNNSNNNSWLSDYFYEERLLAAYTSLQYGLPYSKTKFIAGARYDRLEFDALSPLDTTGLLDGTFTPYEGSWENVLPSASVIHYFTADLRLKAAFSQSLGRPQFDDIAQAERRDTEDLTITRGNPNLQPRHADNYDLTLEYFFGREGIVAVSGFYKNITDDIYTMTATEDVDGDGVLWTTRSPQNASTSKMRGLEFVVTHNAIPGLPGFLEKQVGVSLNYTKLWGEMDYLSGNDFVHLDSLQYQPDWMANATVFYKFPNRKGEFRIAYNLSGERPISLGASAMTTYWLREQQQLDLGFRYSISRKLIVRFHVNNLTEEPVSQGYQQPYAMDRYELSRNRSFVLDFTYKL